MWLTINYTFSERPDQKNLIQIDCDFNLKDENGFSSLHLATQLNNYAGVVNLLKIPTIDLNVIYYFNTIYIPN